MEQPRKTTEERLTEIAASQNNMTFRDLQMLFFQWCREETKKAKDVDDMVQAQIRQIQSQQQRAQFENNEAKIQIERYVLNRKLAKINRNEKCSKLPVRKFFSQIVSVFHKIV